MKIEAYALIVMFHAKKSHRIGRLGTLGPGGVPVTRASCARTGNARATRSQVVVQEQEGPGPVRGPSRARRVRL